MGELQKVKVPLEIYSTKVLAGKFDVSRQTIATWRKSGEIPVRYAQKIIDLLRGV